jgi:hypothetical protein
MKNKGLTYLLLIIVAIIWYQVFFRIKSNLLVEDVFENKTTQKIARIDIVKDTFALIPNYRDPFGGKISKSIPIDTLKNVKKSVQISIPKVENWYAIKYFGLIQKTGSKNPLAILKIDGSQFSLRVGDEAFDGYVVKAIYKDSVLIKYKNKSKYFYKN